MVTRHRKASYEITTFSTRRYRTPCKTRWVARASFFFIPHVEWILTFPSSNIYTYGRQERNETGNLQDLKKKNSFQFENRLHDLVDEIRECYLIIIITVVKDCHLFRSICPVSTCPSLTIFLAKAAFFYFLPSIVWLFYRESAELKDVSRCCVVALSSSPLKVERRRLQTSKTICPGVLPHIGNGFYVLLKTPSHVDDSMDAQLFPSESKETSPPSCKILPIVLFRQGGVLYNNRN